MHEVRKIVINRVQGVKGPGVQVKNVEKMTGKRNQKNHLNP